MRKRSALLKTNTYAVNRKNKANGLDLLAEIGDEMIATVFFETQYRGVLGSDISGRSDHLG